MNLKDYKKKALKNKEFRKEYEKHDEEFEKEFEKEFKHLTN
jgi:hypothetical protein